jgi:NADPH:quinone reductase-like Zn-dependent oxidoreductase
VTGLCSTANLELVRDLGAERVIDYTQPGFRIAERSFDAVLDAVSVYPLSACASWLKRDGIHVTALDGVAGALRLLRDKVVHGPRKPGAWS